jgi:hypothetical protein
MVEKSRAEKGLPVSLKVVGGYKSAFDSARASLHGAVAPLRKTSELFQYPRCGLVGGGQPKDAADGLGIANAAVESHLPGLR